MKICGRFVVNAISVGNMKLCFKSVATCHFVQTSNNDGLRIFSSASFEIFPSLTNWIALLLIIFRALLSFSQHIFETSAKPPGLCYVPKCSFLYNNSLISVVIVVGNKPEDSISKLCWDCILHYANNPGNNMNTIILSIHPSTRIWLNWADRIR